MEVQALVLPAQPASAGQARRFVRECLRECQRRSAIEDAALLCVSELVANVARHTPSRQCVISVVDQGGDVTIEVIDESDAVPSAIDGRDPMDETGRGLRIVEALAKDWGVRCLPGHGKSIWLRF